MKSQIVRNLVAVCATAASIACASPAFADNLFEPWSVGESRELKMGVYTTFVGLSDGWQIWKEESSFGTSCSVEKGPGVDADAVTRFYGSGSKRPTILIRMLSAGPSLQVIGRHGISRQISYRPEGEKFVSLYSFGITANKTDLSTLLSYDGLQVEMSARTCEYEEIGIGCVDDRGIVDFTGVISAFEQLAKCEQGDSNTTNSLPQN